MLILWIISFRQNGMSTCTLTHNFPLDDGFGFLVCDRRAVMLFYNAAASMMMMMISGGGGGGHSALTNANLKCVK